MAFNQATRKRAKLRLALGGLSGRGKTFSALLIASILAELLRDQFGRRGRIAVLDTEHESASLYAMTDEQLEVYRALTGAEAISYVSKANAFDFAAQPLDNHSPRAYVDGIHEAEAAGFDFVLIDSLSHAWAGKNGALEQKDSAAVRGGNSWTAWRDITPMHNALVDTMLSCRMHLFATLRQKMEYIQVDKKIEKVGMANIQREGMEYEFTIFGDMEQGNSMRIAKHRLPGVLNIDDVFEKPGEALARKLHGWLMSGAIVEPTATPAERREWEHSKEPEQRVATQDLDHLSAIDRAESHDHLNTLIPALKLLTGAVLEEARKRFDARWTKLQGAA